MYQAHLYSFHLGTRQGVNQKAYRIQIATKQLKHLLETQIAGMQLRFYDLQVLTFNHMLLLD